MDTRFWGPSGWKLLHLTATAPVAHPTKVLRWFELLPYVLPCKYCRYSLSEYYEKLPLTLATVKSPSAFSRWAYEIHNMVNDKLRGQGLLNTPNPAYEEVHELYKTMAKTACDSPMIGWDFLASIAYTTPTKGVVSKPMPDIPSHSLTLSEQNRYNVLPKSARITALQEWWSLIPASLPCHPWRAAWSRALSSRNPMGSKVLKNPPLTAGRGPVSCWLWDLESSVCSCLKCPTAHQSLPALKSELSAFESSCGTAKKRRTCRAKRDEKRKAALTRRIQMGGALVH
jgi:hypothetical protein